MVLLLHKFWQFSIQLFLTIKYVNVVHPLCWRPDKIHVVQCSSFIWAQCCSTWFSVFPAVHHILHRGSSCSNCSEYRSSFATLVWHCLQTASVVVHHFTLHQLLFITDRCSSQLPIPHHSPILFVIGSQCDPVSSSTILPLNLPPQLRWDWMEVYGLQKDFGIACQICCGLICLPMSRVVYHPWVARVLSGLRCILRSHV